MSPDANDAQEWLIDVKADQEGGMKAKLRTMEERISLGSALVCAED